MKKLMRAASIICLASVLAAGLPPAANGFVLGSCRWSEMQILHLTYGNGNLTSKTWEAARLSVMAWSNIAPQINLVETREGEIPTIIFLNQKLPMNAVGVSVTWEFGGRCKGAKIIIDEEKISIYKKQHAMQLLSHEFGHALGIGHSDKPRSIMSITHQSWDEFGVFVAGRDEFYALEELYGPVGDGDIWGRGLDNNDY